MTCKLTVIASGKGGVGKSTVAALFSGALAKMGRSALVVEFDAGLRSLDIMMGVENKAVYDLSDVFSGGCSLETALVRSDINPRLYLLPAPHDYCEPFDSEKIVKLLTQAKEEFNDVIVDLPSGVYGYFDAVFSCADFFFLVVTPDVVSVRDGAILSRYADLYPEMTSRLIINRVPARSADILDFQDLDEVIDTVGLQLIGLIKEDEGIKRITSRGLNPDYRSYADRVIERITNRYLGKYVPLADL